MIKYEGERITTVLRACLIGLTCGVACAWLISMMQPDPGPSAPPPPPSDVSVLQRSVVPLQHGRTMVALSVRAPVSTAAREALLARYRGDHMLMRLFVYGADTDPGENAPAERWDWTPANGWTRTY